MKRSTFGLREPVSEGEALTNPVRHDSMIREINNFLKYDVFEVVKRDKDMKVATLKWIYKSKLNENNTLVKFKSRLAVRGFSMEHEVNFWETFASTTKYSIIRMLLSLAVTFGWEIESVDVEAAFLTAAIDGRVYVQPLKSLRIMLGLQDEVLMLTKSLYGTKQDKSHGHEQV